jgi:hypothetical protein
MGRKARSALSRLRPRGLHAGTFTPEATMEVLHPRCAGLDVHKDTVVACARIPTGADVNQEVRTFGTRTKDLWSSVTTVAPTSWAAHR